MVTARNFMKSKKISLLVTAVACSLVSLASCSRREPPPLELIGAAKMAVHDAERGDHTAQLAPTELQSARTKLETANRALNNRDNLLARRMSEQAIVDAQLANAKTLTAQTNLGVHEVRDALRDVRREIQKQ